MQRDNAGLLSKLGAADSEIENYITRPHYQVCNIEKDVPFCRLSHKKAVLLSKASLALCLACVSVAAASGALPLSGKHVLASPAAPAPGAADCSVKDQHQLLILWVHSQASYLTKNLSWALNALPQSNFGSCSFSTVHAT